MKNAMRLSLLAVLLVAEWVPLPIPPARSGITNIP
jgi:hypothetical protein